MDYYTIKYIQNKLLKPKIDSLTTKVKLGVDNFAEYKYIIGQIRSSEDLQQDLTDLLKKQEPDDNKDTGEDDT